MKAFNYLKRSFALYLTTGIAMGIALFATILIPRYNNHLFQDLYDIKNINISKGKIKRQIQGINSVKDFLRNGFHMDVTDVNSERNIFLALDNIKSNLQGAVITVDDIQEKNGRKELPLAIVVPVWKYGMALDYLNYLASFRIPDYEIKHILISKEESGAVSLSIKGTLVMPVPEVQEDPRDERYG